MRHVTWAAAWFLVGLAVVLGTASVLEQRSVVAERSVTPYVPTIIEPTPANHKTRPAEPGRQLVAYRKSTYTTAQE